MQYVNLPVKVSLLSVFSIQLKADISLPLDVDHIHNQVGTLPLITAEIQFILRNGMAQKVTFDKQVWVHRI